MVDLIFRINTGSGFVTVAPPRNWTEMKVQLIFDKEQLQLQLQSINFEWVLKEAALLKSYYESGMTGGAGILEGPGLQIYGQIPGGTPYLFFNGCINTADAAFSIQDDIIMCPIRESGKTDWFHSESESFYFHHLASLAPGTPGAISRSDYKQIPYAISSIPDYTQAMLLSITLFIIVKESVDVVMKIVSLIARAISQSLSWIQLIGTIIEIVLYIVYLVAIVTASASLIQQIADNILQPKKTKLGMRELDLWIKMAEYMGLNFVSPIYGYGTADLYGGRYTNMTIIPEKIKTPTGDPAFNLFKRPADETTNPESYGYYEGTGMDFVKAMEMTYNGKAIVRGNTLYFQEKNTYDITDAFIVPNEGVTGNTFLYPQPYGTNASEIPANYCITFQKDDQDLNTYNDYSGTFVLAQTIPVIVNDPKNKLLSGSVRVDLPFAHARRKVGFTYIEKVLLNLLDRYSHFINSIGSGIDEINDKLNSWLPNIVSSENVGLGNTQVSFLYNFIRQPDGGIITGPIAIISMVIGSDGLPIIPNVTIPSFSNDRVGWMLLSSDFIGVEKRFLGTPRGDDWYVDENNSEGTFTTTIPTSPISGTFSGTYSGLGGIGSISPTTVSSPGIITVSIPTALLGPSVVVISGTITGFPGVTFTATISGASVGGTFIGTGMINTASSSSSYATQGYGSAAGLYNDFHVNNMISHNQWLTFEQKTFKFTMADFVQVSEKNILIAPTGEAGKFRQLVWKLHDDVVVDVDYRLKHKYTNNYQINVSTDVG